MGFPEFQLPKGELGQWVSMTTPSLLRCVLCVQNFSGLWTLERGSGSENTCARVQGLEVGP